MQYKVQGPDGQVHVIEGPDGASQDEVIAQAQQLFGSQPAQPKQPTFADIAKGALGMYAGQVEAGAKDVASNVAGIVPQVAQGANELGNLVNAPTQIAGALSQGEMPQVTAGQGVAPVAAQTASDIASATPRGVVEGALAHPLSTAMGVQGALEGASGLAEALKPETITEQTPSMVNKITGGAISEEAVRRQGWNQPTPTKADVSQSAANVQQMIEDNFSKQGKIRNKALEDVEIPATKEDQATSQRRYDNQFGLNTNQPLKLPDNLTANAPKMEQDVMGATTKDDVLAQQNQEAQTFQKEAGFGSKAPYDRIAPTGALTDTVNSSKPGYPPMQFRYAYREPGYFDTSSGKMAKYSDATNQVVPDADKFFFTEDHPELGIGKNSQQSISDIKNQFGYDLQPEAQKMVDMRQSTSPAAPPTPKPMPFKFGPVDTPQQLEVETKRFLANQDYIHPQDQTKGAMWLKDQIANQNGVITPSGKSDSPQLGRLKSLYGDLNEIVKTNAPDLADAQGGFKHLYDQTKEISNKMSGAPGGAESYLRKVFTSNDPAMMDDRTALQNLDKANGTHTVDDLFNKLAGEEYGQIVGKPMRDIMEIPHRLLTSPAGIVAPLSKYGPGALKAVASALPAGAGAAALKNFRLKEASPESYSALQSLRDRMGNQ